VDPGHGGQIWGATRGYTGGTRSKVTDQNESDANLRVGLYLWDLLTQAGAEVVMTRTFETRLSADCYASPDTDEYKANRREELNIRCRVAEANNSDFLISIHHNAGGGPDTNFATAFFFEGGGSGQNEVKHSPEAVEMAKKLASAITDSLGSKLSLPTRPARHGNYHVLRETSLPAVIVECSFMWNVKQSEWMEDLAYSRLAAIAIFEGILKACEEDKNTGEVQQ
jgi:N-acetylmuramoyl-L-alanine amidase